MTARLTPDREWWTAEEIAAAALPDLPGTKRGVNVLADRQDWRGQHSFARRRAGKGGGWEYSWQLFPSRAKRKLLTDVAQAVQPAQRGRDEVWQWYESLPASVSEKAQARLKIIQEVEALEPSLGRHMACVSVARLRGIGARTIWGWFAMIEGVRADDRLPYLAPRNRAAEQRGRQKDCDPEFFDLLKSDFLRLEAPTFSDCYRRSVRIAHGPQRCPRSSRSPRRRSSPRHHQARAAAGDSAAERHPHCPSGRIDLGQDHRAALPALPALDPLTMHRPYFARRPPDKPARRTDVDPADLRAAHATLVASTRRFLPGGELTKADLHGVTKRIAATFNVPVEAVVTALSMEV